MFATTIVNLVYGLRKANETIDELKQKVEYLMNASNRHEAVIGEIIEDIDEINDDLEDLITYDFDDDEDEEECDCDDLPSGDDDFKCNDPMCECHK